VRRRDVLAALLGAPLALACDDEETPPSVEGELLGQSHEVGHLLRDEDLRAAFARGDVETRDLNVAIVGAGPAGLSAAWQLARRGIEGVELFELEPHPGGTSASGRSEVTAYPWGAHYLPVPGDGQPELRALLGEMDALDDAGEPREHLLVRAPDERVFYRGYWYRGLYPTASMTAHDAAQRERFERIVARWVRFRDGQGRRAFTIPSRLCSDDAEVLALDRISAAEWCRRQGFTSPRLLWWLEYGTRDDHGLTLEDASAWSLLFYHCARVEDPEEESADFLTWPAGNGALVRHLARGRRVHTGHLAARIAPDGTLDVIEAATRRPLRIRARRVICATPRFVASRLVEGAPPSDDGHWGAWMVANLHLADRPGERGFPPAWDNVLYDSPSLGYVTATHQRGRDFGPTVWTYYFPLVDSDPTEARRRLLDHGWSAWTDAIVADLSRAHPDLRRQLRRVDVWRWGHAMAQPRVGVRRSEARRRAALPVGKVHFAHSDLSGLALFEEAFDHGLRAADEVADALSEEAT